MFYIMNMDAINGFILGRDISKKYLPFNVLSSREQSETLNYFLHERQ